MEGSGKAVFNAKWSLPDGVTVTSATIYRGKSSTDKNFEAATLKTKGTPYDTGLRVRTGDFTLNLDSLTTGYHYVCIVIDYIEGGTTKELISDVQKWSI